MRTEPCTNRRKSRRRIAAALIISLCGVAPLVAGGGSERGDAPDGGRTAVRTVEEQFPFASGGTIALNLETGGEITVVGWERDEVELSLRKRGANPELIAVVIRDTPRRITVGSRLTERNVRGRHSLDVEIRAPRSVKLDLTTTGGTVDVTGIEGELKGQTLGGDVALSEFTGSVSFRTMGGAIAVRESDLDGSITTMGGHVNLERVEGDLAVETMGGNIVRRGSTRDGAESMTLSTMGGSIEIDESRSEVLATTMGGNVTVRRATAGITVETMGGAIVIEDAGGDTRATSLGGDVTTTVSNAATGTERNVHLESKGGDIVVRLPVGMPFNIEVFLDITHEARRDYRIVSDVPLDEHVEAGRPVSGVRETRRGVASIGGGGNDLYLSTVDGNVTIQTY